VDQNLIARRFIVLARKLRDDVRKASGSLASKLSNIHTDFQKHIEAISKATETANAKQSGPPEVIARVHLSETVEIQKSTSDTRDDKKYQRRTLFVAWVTFIAIFGYAVLVFFQLREMIGATGAAQRTVDEARRNRVQSEKYLDATIAQFHLDQRAWVAVVDIKGTPELDKVWIVTVRARNSGKTFAKELRGTTSATPVPKGKSLDFVVKENKTTNTNPVTVAVLAPNADFENVIGDPAAAKINQTALDNLTHGDITEFVHGRLSYRDVFGCPHWTTYCFSLGTNLRWVGCNEHNSADDETCANKK
jgi:hypothetical protein